MEYQKELVDLACAIYRETRSGPTVSKRLDVSIRKAYALLEAGGILLQDRPREKRSKHRLAGEVAAVVIKDYMEGMKSKELESKYGVGMWAIRETVRRSRVDIRKKGGTGRVFTEEELETLTSLHKAGLTQTQIAAALKSNQATISKKLKRLGLFVKGNYLKGENSKAWRGGRILCGSTKQYVGIFLDRDDPFVCMSSIAGYALEHRVVMARSIGRPLERHETVHHINGNTQDNRIENLQLRNGRHGRGVVHRCRDCGSTNIESTRLH